MVNLARSKSDQPTVEIFTIEPDLPDAHIFHRYLSEPDCYSRNGQDHHGSTHPNSRQWVVLRDRAAWSLGTCLMSLPTGDYLEQYIQLSPASSSSQTNNLVPNQNSE
jgi:hypothetical protein